MTTIPFAHVDAFTSVPFGGSPAVVCRVPEWPAAERMQQIAAEMNVGATAFVRRGPDAFSLRWFSPTVELELCGHGTLAAACVLWENGDAPRHEPIQFDTRGGRLTATRDDRLVAVEFPTLAEQPAPAPDGLLDALGITNAVYVGRNRLDYLVEVNDEAVVRALAPQMSALASIDTRGVIVTSRSADAGTDFVSRFFAPAAGIDEDFATGSAHGCLARFWSGRLGRARMRARQLSRRGAVLHVEVAGDRVRVGGEAVIISDGRLIV